MFEILHEGVVIGTSALELGDPPMACAEGVLRPAAGFAAFRANVAPEPDGDPDLLRWTGLACRIAGGGPVPCIDVVLFEFDAGEGLELWVDVLGIDRELHDALFPDRA